MSEAKSGMNAEIVQFAPNTGKGPWLTEKPVPDTFLMTPEKSTYEQRRSDFVTWVSEKSPDSVTNAMCAVKSGKIKTIPDAPLDYTLSEIRARKDCADFDMIRAVQTLYFCKRHKCLTPVQEEKIKREALDFMYWVDEPGKSEMIFWTENHTILFHAAEYLMGQMYPDEIFTNNGKTGRWHMEHARPLILQWIDRRARWGFSEWDSNVYYAEDISALLPLVDYANDTEIASQASKAVDLMLLDIASDLWRGVYATSHGRSYTAQITSARRDSMSTLIRVVWGTSLYRGSDMDAVFLALNERYVPPAAIIALGRDISEEFEGRERHGIRFEDSEKFGLSFNNIDDAPAFWAMGAHTQRKVLLNSIRAFDRWNLWETSFLADAAPYVKGVPRNSSIFAIIGKNALESDRTLLGEVNKVTYRTPDYQISSAQDYRPGEIANQHLLWTAALGPDALVYTTHPGSQAAEGDRTPTYWAGTNRIPRIAQYKNTLVAVYNIEPYPVLAERYFMDFTHAYFPRWAFDETAVNGNWHFGRSGDGYIALFSSTPPIATTEGRDAGVELVANSRRNIWICRMGRRKTDGSFADFINSVTANPPAIDGLDASINVPGTGLIKFGWQGPLTVNGVEVPTSDFRRVDNPFATSDYDSGRYSIDYKGMKYEINFR